MKKAGVSIIVLGLVAPYPSKVRHDTDKAVAVGWLP